MRKIVLIALMFMAISISSHAEEIKTIDIGNLLEHVPFKQGIGYSLQDGSFSYLSTVEIAQWKDFNFEAGFSSSDKIVGILSYDLVSLKEYGVELPILNLINFNLGLYGGYGRIALKDIDGNNEFDYGVSLSIINIKF